MKVRIATEFDLDDICALSEQISLLHYQNAPKSFTKPISIEKDRLFWTGIFNQENSVFFVVEVDNYVQGFITARITENPDIPFLVNKKVCRIGTIVVSENCQGLGIGKLLMVSTEKWAKGEDAVEIRLEVMEFNDIAQKFYDSIGYETYSRILSKAMS